jgi:peptidyl-prolyl cis-trans isomerase D
VGDLDWFNPAMMAPQFSAAVLQNNVGEFVLAETAFGYHIIKVTGKKDFSRQIQVAILTQDIEPSKETIAAEYARASRFTRSIESMDSFEKGLEDEGIAGSEAILNHDMYAVQTIQDGRELVRWAFNKETIPGETTKMFEFPDKNQYVVCIVKSRRDKGQWELDEDLKKMLEPLVIREKKFEMIAAEFEKTGSKDLYTIASKMNVAVDTTNISFNLSNLMNYGPEVRVIGTAFGQPKGKITEPIQGVISAFVLVVDEKIKAGEPENLVEPRMNEERTFGQLMQQNFDRALEKASSYVNNQILWF